MTRQFAFEYQYRGTDYAMSLPAEDEGDARAKLAAMTHAEFKGEIVRTISVVSPDPLTATTH